MKIPHSAHASKLAEHAAKLVDSHRMITHSVSNHAERHSAAMDALRKQLELEHAIEQGAKNMA